MANMNQVLVFSPPHKKERMPMPSEFLLLKPFSRALSISVDIAEPGQTKTAVITVQNIDEVASRLYFEVPAGKPVHIKPESTVIQPNSVEVFEVVVAGAKESFRSVIKVFAPDLKFYRGGQVNLAVTVKQPAPKVIKKKKERKIEPVPKIAVTVPKEFKFQPSRDERKKAIKKELPSKQNVVPVINQTTALPSPSTNKTFNLDDIRRQTNIIKHAMDVNQTYLIPPKPNADPQNPLVFVRTLLQNDSEQDLLEAIYKFHEVNHADDTEVTEDTRSAMNRFLNENMPLIEAQNFNALIDGLKQIASEQPAAVNEEKLPAHKILQQVQANEKSRRSSTRATSSPKKGDLDEVGIQTPEKLSGISSMTLNDMVSNYLSTSNLSQMESMTVPSPDVSAIFPIGQN